MAYHGDVTEITINNPDLGTRAFFPKAGESNSLIIGGVEIADDTSSVTSSGTPIYVGSMKLGSLSVLIENDMVDREDQVFLQALAGASSSSTFTVSIINGSVWKGQGRPVGTLEADIMNGTMPLKVNAMFTKIQ